VRRCGARVRRRGAAPPRALRCCSRSYRRADVLAHHGLHPPTSARRRTAAGRVAGWHALGSARAVCDIELARPQTISLHSRARVAPPAMQTGKQATESQAAGVRKGQSATNGTRRSENVCVTSVNQSCGAGFSSHQRVHSRQPTRVVAQSLAQLWGCLTRPTKQLFHRATVQSHERAKTSGWDVGERPRVCRCCRSTSSSRRTRGPRTGAARGAPSRATRRRAPGASGSGAPGMPGPPRTTRPRSTAARWSSWGQTPQELVVPRRPATVPHTPLRVVDDATTREGDAGSARSRPELAMVCYYAELPRVLRDDTRAPSLPRRRLTLRASPQVLHHHCRACNAPKSLARRPRPPRATRTPS
jgi:hypothetical protein